MKNIILTLTISVLALSVVSFTGMDSSPSAQSPSDAASFEMPANVKAIIDNSCYGCHNSNSNSMKAKMKLKFDKMPHMRTGKLVGKLSKISKMIKKGKMPPKKFLENYHDKALSVAQANTLTSWADGLAQKLSGE